MSSTLKWGLITGMVYVIFSLISNMLGLQQGGGGSAGLGFLVNVLLFGATFYTIYLGIKEIRDTELDGNLNLGQAIRKGIAIALIAGVISALFTLLYMLVIDPGLGDRILETAEEQWDKMGVPEEQREMSRKVTGWFLNPAIMAPFMLIWVCFWGLIKALIAGSMLKKEAPPVVPEA